MSRARLRYRCGNCRRLVASGARFRLTMKLGRYRIGGWYHPCPRDSLVPCGPVLDRDDPTFRRRRSG